MTTPALQARPWQSRLTAVPALVYLRTMGLFCVLWYAVAQLVPNKLLLPSPIDVAYALRDSFLDGDLFDNAVPSSVRLVASVAMAAIVAIPLGLVIGRSQLWEDVFDLPLEILRPIAGIAWIPLALFIFGIGNGMPLFIMTYTAFFPLLIGTASAARSTDPRLVAAAATMGVSGRTLLWRVILPAALPAIIVSARLSVAACWTAVVAAELVGAPNGLGYALDYYRSMLMTPSVMSFIVVIGVLGFLSDRALRLLGRVLMPWSVEVAR